MPCGAGGAGGREGSGGGWPFTRSQNYWFDSGDSSFRFGRTWIARCCRICHGVAFDDKSIAVHFGIQISMKLLRFAIVLGTTSLRASALNAQELKPLTVDALVAKNIEAKGGIDALRAVKSLRFTGRLLVNQGQLEFAYTQTKERPGRIRTDATLQGMTLVHAYDGAEGWKISPFDGRKDPEKMSVDDAKWLVEDAEIDGPLVDWEAKGSTVEYLGPEDVEGTLAHKLKVVRKNGDVSYVYLDPDYFLEIRILTQRLEQGSQVEVETDLGDYEKIAGVFFPFSLEAGPKGSSDKQKIVIEKAEANVPIDAAAFKFPPSTSK
jgi:hypothetical protein